MSDVRERPTETQRRDRLDRARVVAAAIHLADRDGIEAVSMRKLGQELGVEAMSLYTHVDGKDDLLDGMADALIATIPAVDTDGPWRPALRRTILAARGVLLQHRWAANVVESRSGPGPSTIRHMDTVARILLEGGLGDDLAHHAMHVLGSRVLGFSQDLYDDKADVDAGVSAEYARQLAAMYPSAGAIAMAASHEGGLGGCDDDVEFAFGLDLILDGLEAFRLRQAQISPTVKPSGKGSVGSTT